MKLERRQHDAETDAALDAVGPAAVVVPELVLELLVGRGLVGFVQRTHDGLAVTAVQAQLGHDLEMLAGIDVEMGQDKGLGYFHEYLVGSRFRRTVTGFLVLLKFVALVVLLGTHFDAHVVEQAEHGVVADDGESVDGDGPCGRNQTVGIEIAHHHGSATIGAGHPIIVGRQHFHVHAVQIFGGNGVRQGEELLLQVYLGLGSKDGQEKKWNQQQSFHRNISSISISQTISAFSITVIRNLSFCLKKRTFSG